MRASPVSSPTSAMSHRPSSLATLAHSKLQSGLASGARDNLSLHRWVLLKNSISGSVRDDYSAEASAAAAPYTPCEEEDQDRDSSAAPSLVPDAPDAEDDDEEDDLNLDGLYNFLFPDPGHAHGAHAPQDAASIESEAQWFDSLLETLGDDDTEDDDNNSRSHHHHLSAAVKLVTTSAAVSDEDLYHHHSTPHSPPPSDPVSPASSYSDDCAFAFPPPIAVPYPVPYPPLVKPYGAAAAQNDTDAEEDDEPCYYAPRARPAVAISDTAASGPVNATAPRPYFLPYNDLEDSYLSMPDAMEDSASDDDSEMLPSTPFSRSRSSLSLSLSSNGVDPASVPLPRDHFRHPPHHRVHGVSEPRIYSSADDVYAFDPNLDLASDAAPVYTPFFFQNC